MHKLFLMIVTIALKIRNPFYKLIALGLGTEYAFQVFLTIGGATKFIPMTGVTLPLVSYGGSSVMCTILMLAIIQGLYILRKMRTNKLKRSEKKRLKEEEREQRLREREIARLRRKKNRPLTFVSAFFILIFVSLIGYLVYFDAIKAKILSTARTTPVRIHFRTG